MQTSAYSFTHEDLFHAVLSDAVYSAMDPSLENQLWQRVNGFISSNKIEQEIGSGWRVVVDNKLHHLSSQEAVVVENSALGKVVILCRGTSSLICEAILNDISGWAGMDQRVEATLNSVGLKAQEYADRNGLSLSVAGHSLGGSVAEAVAGFLHVPVFTFNALQLRHNISGEYSDARSANSHNVRAWRLEGDLISVLGGLPLDLRNNHTTTLHSTLNPAQAHRMTTLLKEMLRGTPPMQTGPGRGGDDGVHVRLPHSEAAGLSTYTKYDNTDTEAAAAQLSDSGDSYTPGAGGAAPTVLSERVAPSVSSGDIVPKDIGYVTSYPHVHKDHATQNTVLEEVDLDFSALVHDCDKSFTLGVGHPPGKEHWYNARQLLEYAYDPTVFANPTVFTTDELICEYIDDDSSLTFTESDVSNTVHVAHNAAGPSGRTSEMYEERLLTTTTDGGTTSAKDTITGLTISHHIVDVTFNQFADKMYESKNGVEVRYAPGENQVSREHVGDTHVDDSFTTNTDRNVKLSGDHKVGEATLNGIDGEAVMDVYALQHTEMTSSNRHRNEDGTLSVEAIDVTTTITDKVHGTFTITNEKTHNGDVSGTRVESGMHVERHHVPAAEGHGLEVRVMDDYNQYVPEVVHHYNMSFAQDVVH